jgi:hypothetical protein
MPVAKVLETASMKSKVNVVLLGILIFVLGGIAGAVINSLYREYLKAAFFRSVQQPPDIIGGIARELKLDAKQTESLRVIFDESRKRYLDLAHQFWPQYETIRKETDQKIKDILRDDQRARFEDFLKKAQPPPPMPPAKRQEGKRAQDPNPGK